MAQGNFERALARILEEEGGKANLRGDPGGRTNQGVTQDVYNAYREELRAAPRTVYDMEQVERDAIYRKYWDAVGGDRLPAGVDFAAFDASVQQGMRRAQVELERAPPEPAAAIASMTAQRQAALVAQAQHDPRVRPLVPGMGNRIAAAGRFALSWAGPQPGAFDAARTAILNSEHGLIHHHDRSQIASR